jgi:acyl-CoA thioester hydrolase
MTDRPTAGRFEGREHRLPVRVYYEDTDFTGLVYHGNYVRYFERGRSDALRLMGIGHAELLDGDQPMAFVVSKMALDFLKPARIDDELLVRTRYEAIKGPRLLISQVITRGDDALCRAGVEAVCIHMDGRPRRPPAALRDKVGPWLTGEA